MALALRIFAKEVVVMTSRPGTRWGLADSITAEADRHIAGYKLPKAIVFCARPQRSPYGKADDHGRKPEWHKLAERMSGLIRHSGLRRRRYRMCPPRNDMVGRSLAPPKIVAARRGTLGALPPR